MTTTTLTTLGGGWRSISSSLVPSSTGRGGVLNAKALTTTKHRTNTNDDDDAFFCFRVADAQTRGGWHRNHHRRRRRRRHRAVAVAAAIACGSKNVPARESRKKANEKRTTATTRRRTTKRGGREEEEEIRRRQKQQQQMNKSESSLRVEASTLAFAVAVAVSACVMYPDLALADVVATAADEEQSTGGFAQAFLLILLSELGDKTFFISLLLALKEKKSSVFLGTFGALAVMTALSVCIGQFFHVAGGSLGLSESAIPFDDILAVLLLLYFGINTIKGAEDADDVAEEEKEEAKVEIGKMQFSGDQALILSTFALVFAAEWGDKSFFATIALAAAQDPTQVFLGGTAGHCVATGLAVLTGDLIGEYLSEKVVAYAGGALFISFAVGTLIEIFEKLN